MLPKIRQRKCRCGCGEYFTPRNSLQIVAGPSCAVTFAQGKKAKIERELTRKRREQLKTRSDWLKDAQAAFNAWIRARDESQPCISCGRFHQGSYDAGHYRSVGACPELRFHPDNVHKQCVPCNQHKSGNIVEMRIGLTARIGKDRVEWLEGPHEPKKYTIDEAKAIRDEYRAKLKKLKKEFA